MKKETMLAALLALATVALLALPGAAKATTDGWCPNGCVFNDGDWIDPNDDPIAGGMGGNVGGGDGATCSLIDRLRDVCDDDLEISPCYRHECNGDNGEGPWEPTITCGIVLIRCLTDAQEGGDGNPNHEFEDGPPPSDPYADQGGTNYTQCPGADDDAFDPNDEDCW